jgi:ABC-type transporter Mla subunit MlaD
MPQSVKKHEQLQRQLADTQAERQKLAEQAARLEAALRHMQREERRKLQAEVGKIADAAGLLAYDLPTLMQAFTRLAAALGAGADTPPGATGDADAPLSPSG